MKTTTQPEESNNERRETLDRLLTFEELAHKLQVSKSWLYSRTSQRRIPMRKIGKYCRFDSEEISRWVKEMQPKPENDKEGI